MKRWLGPLAAIGIISLLVGLLVLLFPREEPVVRARLVAMAGDASGYLRAEGPVPLDFPADHGPHPDYQTEWWYYTGNLESEDGQRFGYQLTFFRRALTPPSLRTTRDSAWAADQVYMGHLALTDVEGKRHEAFERFSRGAAGLAGAQASPYAVWLEDWRVEEGAPGTVHLQAAQQGWALDLLLVDQKGPILHGDQGYSPKGPEPGNASYYYSLTRLESTGTVQVPGAVYSVDGWSWMDHEWSTSALAADQVGWDWFSLQLDDGTELMAFQLRKEDGSLDPFSSGTFVAPDGTTRQLSREDLKIDVEDTWQSPHTGATYPAAWAITVPAEDLRLEIKPYLADQELNVSFAYWEGAVQAEGTRAGQSVQGSGYVEMTGYAASMQGQF
ncbi:MAG: lipocalin-like domain-containing protein [Anaerolineae bacterium]